MLRTVVALAALLTLSCGPQPSMPDAFMPIGTSGATCPPGSTLTWETFGEDFFATYCTRCHASTLVGPAARSGAPEGRNWDSHETVMMFARQIDEFAAAGPLMTNTFMPISGMPIPPDSERFRLGEYLACGAR